MAEQPRSPHLNIKEAVWDHLDRGRNQRQTKSTEDLKMEMAVVNTSFHKREEHKFYGDDAMGKRLEATRL